MILYYYRSNISQTWIKSWWGVATSVERALSDHEIPGSNPAHCLCPSAWTIYPQLLLSTQVYKWVPGRRWKPICEGSSQCPWAAWKECSPGSGDDAHNVCWFALYHMTGGNITIVKHLEMIINHIRRYINRNYYYYYFFLLEWLGKHVHWIKINNIYRNTLCVCIQIRPNLNNLCQFFRENSFHGKWCYF